MLLPTAETRRALADLDLMGINALRLFPGVEGVASACAARFRLDLD
ncbi:hypothetical protein JIG36_09460 [Actinoplanes sp. LDG1-06]|uniref:Uncharacterized protein n=1 Tax=Paractinoplanes ovalisporus TaxID=2810368 RepID=A0ABS2A7H9_9ACTN|nr:hypothetical protein [Actinoplanes ovalisporus]MBM2615781.1 hypothetical protein [Actinoplanes ovalisporus]